MAHGLPVEGIQASFPRARDVVKDDVPTCMPHDELGDIRQRMENAGRCVVVDSQRCVIGEVDRRDVDGDLGAHVVDVMRPGPTTKRPDEPLGPLLDRMRKHDVGDILITTPEGKLLGAVTLEDAEAYMRGREDQIAWTDCEGCRGSWWTGPV